MSGVGVAPAVVLPTSLRRGPDYWWDGCRGMLAWHLASLRLWLSVLAVIQVLSGVGFVLGIALFFDPLPPGVALFVSTGAPVINLLMVGLVLGPQLVADLKIEQSYDVLRSFPVPVTAAALAWFTVAALGGVPPVAVTLAVAELRYDDLGLAVSADVVPAVLLTCFCGTMLGYAIAHAIRRPMVTRLLTQVLVFVVFGFAPILFPVEQMPDWLGELNAWLPFSHMAEVVRAGLTPTPVSDVLVSYAVLVVWSVASAGLAARALRSRS